MHASNTELCFHCGDAIPKNETRYITVTINHQPQRQPLCCAGCEAVAQLIQNKGLSHFYQLREGKHSKSKAQLHEQQWLAYDDTSLLEQISTAYKNTQVNDASKNNRDHREAIFLVENLYCSACAWLIKNTLSRYPGVHEVLINPATNRMRLVWDQQQTPLSHLLNTIAQLGYHPHPVNDAPIQSLYLNEKRSALKRLAVAGLGMMQVMMNALAIYFDTAQAMSSDIKHFLTLISLLVTTPVVLYAGKPFFIAAWRDLTNRRVGMDVPVALAIGGAYSASVWSTFNASGNTTGELYFDSVCMFVFFLSLGRFAELLIKHSLLYKQDSFSTLLPPSADKVSLCKKGIQKIQTLALKHIIPGDIIQIKTGELIPCDGTVDHLNQHSNILIDESILTGESLPLQKLNGEAVIAGSINLGDTLYIQVTQTGQQTTLAHIKHLLDIARTQKPKLAQLADQIAGKFVLGVLIIASLVAAYWSFVQIELTFPAVLAVLVVSCPCALSLATPTALVAASIRMSKSGLLLTQSNAIEQLTQITHIMFDKTGTLTQGKLQLQHSKALQSLSTAHCQQLAAALEAHAHHPIASAFSNIDTPYQAHSVTTVPGLGIEGIINQTHYRLGSLDFIKQTIACDLKTPCAEDKALNIHIYLANDQALLAEFTCRDQLRAEATALITQLKSLALTPIIASGDQTAAVAQVANTLQIDDYQGQMLPQDKLDKLQDLQKQHCVAMVGDGINDAPVLAAANLSIAMKQGSSLAQSHADIVLLNDNLLNLISAISIARKTKSIIRQNITWAITYNIAAIPLAAAATIAPWVAAIGMSLSSLLVVLNATRINYIKTTTSLSKDRYTADVTQHDKVMPETA